jgi:hypothetical protein
MRLQYLLLVGALAFSGPAVAQRSDGNGSDARWNITGPHWYETQCGHQGFSVTHGLPYADKWRKPCSVPIRVCEYRTMTFSYPADPDVPCERMATPGAGEVVRSYIKRWD